MLLILEAKKSEVWAAFTVITFVSNFLASEVQRGTHTQHDDVIRPRAHQGNWQPQFLRTVISLS
jgi:hypothetical protein